MLFKYKRIIALELYKTKEEHKSQLPILEFGVRIELTTLVLQTSTHPLCIPND